MKAALQLATEGPSQREIELYYFTFEEALDLLKCGASELRACLGKRFGLWQFGVVHWHGQWFVPPDSIPLLREHIWGIR